MLKEKVAEQLYNACVKWTGTDWYPSWSETQEAIREDWCKEATKFLNLFKAEVDKLTVIPTPDHSESVSCPFCGEEFGQESYTSSIREEMLEHTKKQLLEELE